MAMAESDRRLVQEFLKSKERAQAYPLTSPRARELRDVAVEVLATYGAEFNMAVKREDSDELKANAAAAALSSARKEMNEVFGDVRNGLDIRLRELAIERASMDNKTGELRAFIDGYNASDFSKSSTNIIIGVMERAEEFGAQFLPEHLRPIIEGRMEVALEQLKLAQQDADGCRARARAAYSDLLEARVQARLEYRNARDLIGVVLRIERRDSDFNGVIPPLDVALSGRRKTNRSADASRKQEQEQDLILHDGGEALGPVETDLLVPPGDEQSD